MSKVVKFGGSSLASAEQFQKVADIIRSDPERRYVVPSAPGKRFKNDTKVTDMLYACYDLAEADQDFEQAFSAIEARYREIIEGLNLAVSLEGEFETIRKNFKRPAVIMRHPGENISTGLFWQPILGLHLSMPQMWSALTMREHLIRIRRTNCFPPGWQSLSM